MTKIRNCLKHGQYKAELMKAPAASGGRFGGRDIYSGCPKCHSEYEESQAAEEQAAKKFQINEFFLNSGIPKRFKTCSLENYSPGSKEADFAMRVSGKYISSFETLKSRGASLVFCGLPGTGKTHLACAIGNALIPAGAQVRYTTVYQMMADVKSTYGKKSERTESEVIKIYTSCGLLIIDEVGVQYGSKTEEIVFYQIINGRYEEMLPTILISNLVESELTAFIGERCIDRMRDGGGAVVPFAWESYRK